MKKPIPLLARAISQHNAETWLYFVKSLIAHKDSKASKTVQSVSLTFKKDKAVIRVKRDPKLIHREEISLLATEYGKTEEELLKLFAKRNIEVRYDDTDARRLTETIDIKPKRDAVNKPTRGRKKKSKGELLQSGSDPCLSEKGTLHVAERT